MPITLIGSAGIYGGIVPFDPTRIAGCKLWLRSDLGVTKDESDLVSLWADQSGQHNDVSQSVDAAKFTFNTNQIAGYPSLRGDATQKYMTANGVAPYFNGTEAPVSVFWVSKRIGNSNGNIWSAVSGFVSESPVPRMVMEHNTFHGTPNGFSIYRVGDGGTVDFVLTTGLINNNWHYWIMNFKVDGYVDLYHDGTLIVNNNSLLVGAISTIDTFTLNSGFFNGSAISFENAEFAEFGVYNKELLSDEVTQLINYSTDRYGL